MNRQQRRIDAALQRCREEAVMGRNRLSELLPQARAAKAVASPHLGTNLLFAGFTEADIRGAYTYYSGGGWHGDVTLAFKLKLGGGGNRIGTKALLATEADAETHVVATLAALLVEAEHIAAMGAEERRVQTIAARVALADWTGDDSTLKGLCPDEMIDLLLIQASSEERVAAKEEIRGLPRQEVERRLVEMGRKHQREGGA